MVYTLLQIYIIKGKDERLGVFFLWPHFKKKTLNYGVFLSKDSFSVNILQYENINNNISFTAE